MLPERAQPDPRADSRSDAPSKQSSHATPDLPWSASVVPCADAPIDRGWGRLGRLGRDVCTRQCCPEGGVSRRLGPSLFVCQRHAVGGQPRGIRHLSDQPRLPSLRFAGNSCHRGTDRLVPRVQLGDDCGRRVHRDGPCLPLRGSWRRREGRACSAGASGERGSSTCKCSDRLLPGDRNESNRTRGPVLRLPGRELRVGMLGGWSGELTSRESISAHGFARSRAPLWNSVGVSIRRGRAVR
jgi:hypothetical protein